MKRIIGTLVMSVFVGAGAFAFTPPTSLSTIQTAFGGFSSDLTPTLPFASTMGLNWSSAYIGQFPHFGVGLSGGVVFVPAQSFVNVMNDFGISPPSQLSQIASSPYAKYLGVPLPSVQAEARIGGFILPFDIGIKFGTIPRQANLSAFLPPGLNANFIMAGVQLRYRIVKEGFLIPQISVGAAFNHFSGSIDYTSSLGPITLGSFALPNGSTQTLSLTAPALTYGWVSNSADFSVEVSKTLLFILTPYVGFGVSLGSSTAGGGFASQLQLNGTTLTQAQINSYTQAYQQAGGTSPFAGIGTSQPGIYASASSFNVVPRAILGLSANLLFIKLDVTGMYDIATQKLGATVGLRAQF